MMRVFRNFLTYPQLFKEEHVSKQRRCTVERALLSYITISLADLLYSAHGYVVQRTRGVWLEVSMLMVCSLLYSVHCSGSRMSTDLHTAIGCA